MAELLPIGVIGMTGTELRGDPVVIPAARIGVAYQQCDRRAGRAAVIYAAEDLDLVFFVPARGVAGFAGGAAVEVVAELFR